MIWPLVLLLRVLLSSARRQQAPPPQLLQLLHIATVCAELVGARLHKLTNTAFGSSEQARAKAIADSSRRFFLFYSIINLMS